MSMVSVLLPRSKGNDAHNHIEQGWDGYHEELSSDPTFLYGLLVSYNCIHDGRLQDAYIEFRW